MIRFVLFDLDNTILNFDAGEEKALDETLRSYGLTPSPDIISRYQEINDELWRMLEEGRTTREILSVERFSRLFSEFSIACPGEEVSARYAELLSHQHPFMPGAEEVLSRLHGSYALYIASNGTSWIQWRRIKDAGLEKWFDDIFISEELGANKPDPAFFEKAFEGMEDFRREEAVIIGDSLTSDIKGGLNAGIHTCLFAPGKLPERPDIRPEYTVRSLFEIPGLLEKIQT